MTLNKHLIELSERQSGFVQAPELADAGHSHRDPQISSSAAFIRR